MKRCNKCKIEKDEADFSKKRSTKDGLRNRCKSCDHEYNLKNREQINKRKRERNKLIKDKLKIGIVYKTSKICNKCKIEKDKSEFSVSKRAKKGLQSRCKKCNKEYSENHKKERRERDLNHKEERQKYSKEYGLGHKEEKRKYQKEYKLNHKLEIKEYQKEYDKEYSLSHKFERKLTQAKWRSLKVRGSIILFTKEQYFDRMSMFNYCCAYCGGPWEHDDHVVALSRGGLHILANLRPSCAHCNCSKGNKSLNEWLKDLLSTSKKLT